MILLTAVVAACSSDPDSSDSPGESSSEATITAASGGELRTADGSFTLIVPPGAVSEDTTISFSERSADDAPDGLPDAEGIAFELSPDGTQFSRPATLTVTVPAQEQTIGGETGLATFDLFSVSDSGEIEGLENVTNDFDAAADELTITGELSHFSTIYRTKSGLTVSLDETVPAERAVGSEWRPRGRVINASGDSVLSVHWEFEAGQSISMKRIDAFVDPFDDDGDVLLAPVTFTPRKASLSQRVELDAAFFRLTPTLQCDTAGSGTYTLTADSRRLAASGSDQQNREVRISLSENARCVAAAEATTAAGDGASATVVSGIIDETPEPTSTPAPTATPLPQTGQDGEQLRLVTIAATGQSASGAGGTFTTFEAPGTGGGRVIFHGFSDNGERGVWRFEEDDLTGGELTHMISTAVEGGGSGFASIISTAPPVTESKIFATIARTASDGFTDSIFLIGASGFASSPVNEGDDAPGVEQDARFSQFFDAHIRDSGALVFQANAGVEGLWLWLNGSTSLLAFEGQALPGLAPDWRLSGQNRVRSAGHTDDGTALLYLNEYRITALDGTDKQGDGLWLVGPGDPLKVALTGDTDPDSNEITELFSPSINSVAEVAFLAETRNSQGRFGTSIWRSVGSGRFAPIIKSGQTIESLGIEVETLSNPLILEDGRVLFVAGESNDSGLFVEHILVAKDGEFQKIADTANLPGPDGTPIDRSIFGDGVTKLSANVHGHIAFELGFASGIWIQSPGGLLHRVAGIGDTLPVKDASGAVTEKTATFVEFIGNSVTKTGLPTGFSDEHHLALRAQFSDGTEAILLATFDLEPVVG